MNVDLPALPAGLLVTLGVLALSGLVLDAIALIDLYQRPAEQVVSGRKWVWLVLILLLSLLGPGLYLLAGRKRDSRSGTPAASFRPSQPPGAADVIDRLYGPPGHTSRQ